MAKMNLYGHEIDRQELYEKLHEAFRGACCDDRLEYRVTMNIETGELDVEEHWDSNSWYPGWTHLHTYRFPFYNILEDWYFNEPFEMPEECENEYAAYCESMDDAGEIPDNFVGWLCEYHNDLYHKYLEEAIDAMWEDEDYAFIMDAIQQKSDWYMESISI